MAQTISATELASRLQAGQRVFLLDVRLPQEHELVALPNSTLIPLQQLPVRAQELQVPENVPLVVYCHHGVRSLNAANYLEHLGFREVYSLAGGIDDWSLTVDPSVQRY